MSLADLRRATHEAASGAVAGDETDEGTASAEATPDPAATSAASAEGATDVAATAVSPDSEAAASGTDDVPENYFGEDLSEYTPEQRVGIIAALKKRDDQIGKLLREKEPAAAATQEAAPEPEPITDEAILEALGLDPEGSIFDAETAKAIVPVVRRQIQQEATIAQLLEVQELNEIDRSWRSSLSGLEREFGGLPSGLDHDRVMEFAADNGISNPVDAYWRIVGPGRAAVTDALKVTKEERDAAKASASGTRPTSTAGDSEAPLESKTTKGATKEAAKRILAEMGLGD